MGTEGEPDIDRRAQYIGVGCFTTFVGGVAGGMIFVLVAKVVGIATRCTPAEGLPACDWEKFWMAGIVVGAISLPTLVLRRLRRNTASKPDSEGS